MCDVAAHKSVTQETSVLHDEDAADSCGGKTAYEDRAPLIDPCNGEFHDLLFKTGCQAYFIPLSGTDGAC